ncbi:MAG: ssDNA-binding domain-containing protein [Clostridiales bacterium]|jgi:hypothetical protein|nr:ssDNA-binding domain-containing protein [Clostridiales bacterium]
MNNYDDLLDNAPIGEPNGQLPKEEYAAKKRAERDSIFALSDKTALEVAADGNRLSQYLDLQSRLSRYSAVNALVILAQMPDASRLGDFDYWKEKKCFVKPGQKAISILEPHEYTKEDGSLGTGYNVKKVFNITQINTRDIKTNSPPSYNERQLLKALIIKAPVRITGVDELPDNLGAMTDPKTGEISVRKGMEFAYTFRSVAQELAFAEFKTDPNQQADSSFSAYCASYLLCKKYGVDTQGFDFVNAPAVFEGMDAQGIKGELSQIRAAAEDISGRMAKQLDTGQRATRVQEAR